MIKMMYVTFLFRPSHTFGPSSAMFMCTDERQAENYFDLRELSNNYN